MKRLPIIILILIAVILGVALGMGIQEYRYGAVIDGLESYAGAAMNYALDWQGVAEHYKFYAEKADRENLELYQKLCEMQQELDVYYQWCHQLLNMEKEY